MDNIASIALVSLFFLLAAGGLMVSHVRAWRTYQRENLDAEEIEYRRRQYRRRMQTSAMLGGIAVAVFVGALLTFWLEARLFALVFWGLVLLLLCWVAVLAIMDVLATRRHFSRVRYDCLVEQAKLQAELRRIQAARDNGKLRKVRYEDTHGDENLN